MEEIREKYALLKIKNKLNMDKGTEKNAVALLRRYNIIRNIDSDVNQADARIIIYPSVLMAVTVDDINDFYEMTEKKLSAYARSKDSLNDEDEETFEGN